MVQKLNNVIRFDLHIHSNASAYKENRKIVEESTKENLPVLFNKLQEHKVSLFSITDHNRFDSEIYIEADKLLAEKQDDYPDVKGILSGIEFDVILESGMNKCHIITIFDTKNLPANYSKIEDGLRKNLLEKPDDCYDKDSFEKTLKDIGLNTILIASQRKGIDNREGKHNSLSDSTQNIDEVIEIGYINALEFQKPKVEGILINNLKKLQLPIPLFSGSDCHEWSQYPYHDSNVKNKDFFHSKAKILPTFKGLLMAITSPDTRFNVAENTNISYIDNIHTKYEPIPFVNGINAIIGENGSGKTTLLQLINGRTNQKHVKSLVNDNDLSINETIDFSKIKYIEQGQIIEKFNKNELFSSEENNHFEELDNRAFINAYTEYASSLKECINQTINCQKAISELSLYSIEYLDDMEEKKYYVDIIDNDGLEATANKHDHPKKAIHDLLSKSDSILHDPYFKEYKDALNEIIQKLQLIADDIYTKWDAIDSANHIKNIIRACIEDYLLELKKNTTAKTQEIKAYTQKKEVLINAVMNVIKQSQLQLEWPDTPPIYEGISRQPHQGFYFNKEAQYNGIDMIENFYSVMFTQNYSNINDMKAIDSTETFSEAVRNCGSINGIEKYWKENLDKFLNSATSSNDYITEGTSQRIGNTLGEMSLSYYKYFTQDSEGWSILIVDQPEDNISNNNVSNKLINYIDGIRDKKQIIFVTHNPLLVVNLDVDNVICVENNDGKLSLTSGCLEFEDDDIDILDIVAKNMDGGKETIEKRLKVYGKSY